MSIYGRCSRRVGAAAGALLSPAALASPMSAQQVPPDGYRVSSHWFASLGIDNLLNRKYFLFHPFPQRTLVASLKYSL